VARRQLEDVLVDRDRFLEETLLRVELAGLEVDLRRLIRRAALGVQLGHFQPGAGVLGILLDDLGELGQRLVQLSALEELLRGGQILVLFRDHGSDLECYRVHRRSKGVVEPTVVLHPTRSSVGIWTPHLPRYPPPPTATSDGEWRARA